MTSFDQLYTVDPDKAARGVWSEPDASGATYLVAQYGDLAKARLEKLQAPHKRQFDNGTAPIGLRRHLFAQCLADVVLLDWQDVKPGGKPLPYTKQAAIQLLESSEYFSDFILKLAVDKERYDLEAEATATKN
ncbi:hypothetical protein FNU76_10190 [Chitinimonas arctica]|uniref:Uncharacterized protein n=1 Tax=Chitinimonas arctica TaxID=2594795 RepID=A0A516SEX8_9NEIS|nr:hypothetical protein [Chitinimonas arctica]QDQ26703.1 hypothetical protein FNU76_10190 [Chitinimonas arctica]